MAETKNPFSGPEWEGWKRVPTGFVYKGGYAVYPNGDLKTLSIALSWLVGKFPTPEVARQVVELIKAAERGEPVPTPQTWQPIETALKGRWILVTGPDYECWQSAKWQIIVDGPTMLGDKEPEYAWCGEGYVYRDVTHWMEMPPLPNPPTVTLK